MALNFLPVDVNLYWGYLSALWEDGNQWWILMQIEAQQKKLGHIFNMPILMFLKRSWKKFFIIIKGQFDLVQSFNEPQQRATYLQKQCSTLPGEQVEQATCPFFKMIPTSCLPARHPSLSLFLCSPGGLELQGPAAKWAKKWRKSSR